MIIDFQGPAGRIEALLDEPDPVRAAVVLAHPHPERGGTMRSRVVHEAARGFTRAGVATLRFNFRGVGLSNGEFDGGRGEKQDFAAAVREMRARYPVQPLWAAGYSFGAWIAAAAGVADDEIRALILIAPLVEAYDFEGMVTSPKPKFLIQADHDELSSLKAMHRFYARLEEPKELVVIDAADHAFDGRASEVGDAVHDLLVDFDV